jgi:hypothetical protein
LALKQLMISCENNSKVMLTEFENKGQGIKICLSFYTTTKDTNLSLYSSHILNLFALEGFVGEIN